MMASFDNLHQVGQNLVDLLLDRINVTDTQVGPPLDDPTIGSEAIRVTLLWVTPQPMHRNDLPMLTATGARTQPPVSLSAFYAISTYGTGTDGVPSQAYNLLGQVLQTFHSQPVMELPNPVTTFGDGRLATVHQTTTAELMEKVFTPFQTKHRPWALFEVAPIQLPHQNAALSALPVVKPGGVQLAPPDVAVLPSIEQLTPRAVHLGGRLRIDARYVGSPTHVTVAGQRISAADLIVPQAGGPIFVDLSLPSAVGVTAGSHDVIVAAGNLISEPAPVEIVPPPTPGLDAPLPAVHSLASGDLVLSGQALSTTLELIIWPHTGPSASSEFVTLPLSNVTSTQVTVSAATLGAAGLRPTLYRIVARVAQHHYTPWVLLEIEP